MGDTNTGAAGNLHLDAWESGWNVNENWSDVSWALYLQERTTSNSTWTGDAIGASVQVQGGTVWSGGFTFDWRAGGLQQTLIASGTTRVYHNGDGTGYATVAGNINNTGTTGAGGPASVSQGVPLTTLKVVPGTPSSVAASRISDTQIGLTWAQSSASNGQPTQNTVRCRINDGDWQNVVTIAPANSATVTSAVNQKLVFGVNAANSAGSSAWSADSAPVFTTPAAPTAVTASKNATLDIVVGFTPHVAFSEHQHVIVHGVVAGGATTWDASPLVTLPAGTTSYTHAAPDASKVHVYKVYAQNTDTGALQSAAVTSNSVQLLVAPNKPTLPVIPAYADKAKAFVFSWTHNSVDTTGQTAYEVGYSTDGGTTWQTTGKTASTTQSKTFAANTYAAGQQLTVRVRTWGQATTGGSEGTGASPWSDTAAVTFKTRPTVTITAPVSATPYERSALDVKLGFNQAEGAAFVSAQLTLAQGGTTLEQRTTTTLASTVMDTRVQNSSTYTLSVIVTDSNGLTSSSVSVTFDVTYTQPVAASVDAVYLAESGIAQLNLGVPVPVANLLSDGSFETPGASVVVRTNLCTNPRMLTLTGWSNATPATITQTATASGQQYDVTGAISVNTPITYQATALSVAPNDLVGTSMQVTVPSGFPAVSLLLDAQEYTSGASGIVARGQTITVQPGQTVTIPSAILTVDASGNGFRSVLRFATVAPVGARVVVANCLVEKSGAIGRYFDGSTAAAGDFTCGWTSTADASTSTQNAPQVAATPAVGNVGPAYQSSFWSSKGAKSLALYSLKAGSNAYAFLATTGAGYQAVLVPGKTYTAVGTIHIPSPALTLTTTMLSTFNGTGGAVTSETLPAGSVGDFLVRHTFTVPSDATTGSLRLYGSYTAGETVYWDDTALVEGVYTGSADNVGKAVASAVTVTRTIAGSTETVVEGYPAADSLTILDTTPTIYGDNVYTVTTLSADGASNTVTETLTTSETEWAFLSGGEGFAQIVRFGGELKPQSTPAVDSALVKTAGRLRPIGLYAKTGGLVVSGTGDIVAGYGSSAEDIEAHLLIPGKHCYRDPSGRRMFGMVTGQVSRDTYALGTLAYTVTETS